MKLSTLLTMTLIIFLGLPKLLWADNFTDPNAKNWTLKSRNNGVLVHARKLEGSKYHVVRLEVEVAATPEDMVIAFGYGDGCVSWLSVCIDSKVIEKVSNDNVLIYSAMKMPWPLKNRDYVYRSTTKRAKESGIITLTQVSESGKYPPKNYIRMFTQSKFILEPIDSMKTKVTWFFHPNLGGNAFPSIVNMKAPQESLRDLLTLKKVVER